MCVCVCMYVCMYVFVCMCVSVCMRTVVTFDYISQAIRYDRPYCHMAYEISMTTIYHINPPLCYSATHRSVLTSLIALIATTSTLSSIILISFYYPALIHSCFRVLPYPVLSYPILSYPILSYPDISSSVLLVSLPSHPD